MQEGQYDQLIIDICKQKNIELLDLEIDIKWFTVDYFINNSYIIGNDTIGLGLYNNYENKVISFFHELGHSLDHNTQRHFTKYILEKEAWRLGIEFAKNYNIQFSQDALDWAYSRLGTYFYFEWREYHFPWYLRWTKGLFMLANWMSKGRL